VAEHADLASAGPAQPCHRLDCRRLAGTVRPDDPEDLAFLDGEGHLVDGDPLAVCLA